MALTQSRMMTIIAAARDYQQGLRKLRAMIEGSSAAVASGADPIAALEQLELLSQEQLLLIDPVMSATNLEIEDRHFQRHASHNVRARDKQRRRRARPRGGGETIEEIPSSEEIMEHDNDETDEINFPL